VVGDPPARTEELVESLQLSQPNCCLNIRQAVVEANLIVLVGGPGESRLCGQVPCLRRESLIVADDHSAAAGGDDLVAIEGETPELSDRADLAPIGKCRAEGFGSVLDDRYAELLM
jgi:hypothetical protein